MEGEASGPRKTPRPPRGSPAGGHLFQPSENQGRTPALKGSHIPGSKSRGRGRNTEWVVVPTGPWLWGRLALSRQENHPGLRTGCLDPPDVWGMQGDPACLKVFWSLAGDTQPHPLRELLPGKPGAPPCPSLPPPAGLRGCRGAGVFPAPGCSRGCREVPGLLSGGALGPGRGARGPPGSSPHPALLLHSGNPWEPRKENPPAWNWQTR